jgi:hypothetical protein
VSVPQTEDGTSYGVPTGTSLPAACTGPALVATATVPARSGPTVTVPAVTVTIGYSFAATANTSQVSLSKDNGGTWTTAALTSNVSAATVKTVDVTGALTGSDSAQQIQVCVQGAGGGGTMNVNLVHLDVDE